MWTVGLTLTLEIKLRFQILRRGVDAASENNSVREGSHFYQLASLADSTLAASPLLVVQCGRAELLLLIFIVVK